MPEIGWAGLGIVPEVDGDFYRKLGSDIDPALARVGKSSGSRFGSILGKAAMVTAGGAVAAGFAAFKLGKDSVAQASELNESLNAVNVTYGKMGENVQYLGEQAATSLGLSNSEFNALAVRFSAFAKTVAGSDGVKSVQVLDELTHRASDFASVMNLEVNEAAELFQSGLAGETEPLRRYGLDLSAAAVEAHALAEGIADGKGELTESEKVQARYSLLMKQTAKTQGDFRNTSDSLANQQRILNARWDDARAKLGTALLPILEDATGFILDQGIPAFERFSDWFSKDGVEGLEKFGNFTKDEILPVVEDLGGFLKDAAEFGGDVVEFLNDLPDPAKYAALAAVVGGGAAFKLRGGKGGALGTVGSALGLAKPVPVFVTNPGFGAGGDVPGGKTGPNKAFLTTLGLAGLAGAGTQLSNEALSGQIGDKNAASIAAGKSLGGGGGFGAFVLDIDVPDDEKKEAFDWMAPAARAALNATAAEFEAADIPTELKTEIALNGVPESMRQVRDLIAEYGLTPKEKRTLFEIIGYDRLLSQIATINERFDYASRDRRTQLTIAYANAGRDTGGGIQSGAADTFSSQRNFERATSRMGD